MVLLKANIERFTTRKHVSSAGLYLNRLYGGIYSTYSIPIIKVGTNDTRQMVLYMERSSCVCLSESRLCHLVKNKLKLTQ